MQTKSIFVLLMSLLLAACEVAQPFPTPTATRRPTRTLNPTSTPRPTRTITSSPTATLTPSITPTLAEGTWQAEETRQVLIDRWEVDERFAVLSISPDGKWAAMNNYYEDTTPWGIPGLRVVSIPEGTEWTYLYTDIAKMCCNYLWPLKWSSDGTALYIGAQAWMDWTSVGGNFSAMARINLSTGEIVPILPDLSAENDSYVYAFSSDGFYLAYTKGFGPADFYIRNLASGSIATFDLPISEDYIVGLGNPVSMILWSADNRSLVFSTIQDKDPFNLSTIYVIDLGTYIVRTFKSQAQDRMTYYIPWEWVDVDHVMLQKLVQDWKFWNTVEDDTLVLDVRSGVTSPGPTTTPLP